MTTPGQTDRTRAANHRRAWIGFGAVLLACWPFYCCAILDSRATIPSHPGVVSCFGRDPLRDLQLWICGITPVAALGIILRGVLIRLPAA